ncbi:hypothetical protein B0T26DRAFT_442426 [Lasiosphaeria miniovina]|uniref:Uncharacterized protein n=1 Tax=Lasiosphaeria miniovina TaxID=1954250 RepID=A0AA39ZZ30_9PEZI|nr:uncharacterized protein B0T26DRAFT_442426 [Lasiosphaeria miniovina]KAK0706059.1 hypothetical protein B0T26DRAFT_442426 [Lasiosphaeria miniovina]
MQGPILTSLVGLETLQGTLAELVFFPRALTVFQARATGLWPSSRFHGSRWLWVGWLIYAKTKSTTLPCFFFPGQMLPLRRSSTVSVYADHRSRAEVEIFAVQYGSMINTQFAQLPHPSSTLMD